MGKARVKVSKSRAVRKYKIKRGSMRGNPNKCPICGKFTSKR